MPKKSSFSSSSRWPFIGHDTLEQTLVNGFSASSLPLVLLFAGPHHVGKASAARWLAQRDVCLASQSSRPCGRCSACHGAEHGHHPNIVDLSRVEETTTVDDVRTALRRWTVGLTPSEHRWLIVTDADRLGEAASTVLLKFLEELPRSTTVIMTTSRLSDVLPTIRSRAATYYWHLVSSTDIDHWLQRAYPSLGPMERSAIVARAAGRPGLAAAMMANDADDQQIAEFMSSYETPTAHLQDPAPDDGEAAVALKILGLREVVLTHFDSQRRLWPKKNEQMVHLARQRSINEWVEVLERALAATAHLRHHVQPRLVLNDLLLV